MTFRQYFEQANRRFLARPGERLGQAYFNALQDVRPDLAAKVRANGLDPFYEDERLSAFLSYLSKVWEIQVPPMLPQLESESA